MNCHCQLNFPRARLFEIIYDTFLVWSNFISEDEKQKLVEYRKKKTIEREKMFFKFFNFVCNYYYKKDSIKIKKTNYKQRIIRITKYLTRLVF